MGPDGGGGAAGAARAWVGWWVVSAGLWLWLVDNTHVPELIVGAGVAAIAASAAIVVRQQRVVVLRPRLRWFMRLWSPLVAYVRDTWLLLVALPRRRTGRFVAVPTEAHADDPKGAARRVLTQTAASFSPNLYVIGTDVEREVLLVHQLVPTRDVKADTDPLRLQ